jgi:aspartyl-tRNA(Asn)/glutamyl-tRNA(Gln) amidotransferase subunit B
MNYDCPGETFTTGHLPFIQLYPATIRRMTRWEAVIGLEVHAQLATRSKLFCGCAVTAGESPNSRVCPVCLGLPGALPVLNAGAVDLATLAALALGSEVCSLSVFARKNYFYPDLPKGYQITQHDRPLAWGGALEWGEGETMRRVRIERLHLEEDAGKSLHDASVGGIDRTGIDFNRSGVPLVEIVTRPDLDGASAAADFFERLREVLVEIGATFGNMEEGHLRCDANVSLKPAGRVPLGTPVEVKNLNSFRYLQKALEYEIARQASILEAGGRVDHETRLWDPAGGQTVAMRSKEDAHDYRFFPEPDLPPLVLAADRVATLRDRLPELPEARRRRLAASFGLTWPQARQVGVDRATTVYFESAVRAGVSPRQAANWITGEIARLLNERSLAIAAAPVSPEALGRLVAEVEAGTISGSVAKEVLARMWDTGEGPTAIIAREGLGRIDDEPSLEAIVRQVVDANPKPAGQYRSGKQLVFGFFVGQVMKATGGKADPAIVNRLLARELNRS